MKFINTVLTLLIVMTFTSKTEWLDFIKSHEGKRNHVYEDIFGIKTIGYGHVITAKDGNLMYISDLTADTMLLEDFNKNYKLINKLYPDFNEAQKYSLTHFIFAKGIGNYMNSNLKIAIETNKSQKEVFKEWIHWAKVKGEYNENSMYNRVLEFLNFYGRKSITEKESKKDK